MADAFSGPIFQLNQDREAIVSEVVARELARKAGSERAVELAVNDAALSEIARLEGQEGAELAQWRERQRSLGRRSFDEKRALMEQLLRGYACDVVGKFSPPVYRFATRVVPVGLSLLLKQQDARRGLRLSPRLGERIRIQGHTETLKSLVDKGTVILVPTHSSNLDSLAIGWSLYHLDLPPFTYGAGKNLFSNFLVSFFMHNLGAYKVDRRITHALYKDVLKTYSTVILERGFHSLFFPGGGRSRSNAIESKLKLGLLGTGLEAYINNLRAGRDNPKIFVVPCTLNYHLVLEAETLIEDQLQRVGKSRYIIEDDEFSRPGRIWSFMRRMLELDTSMVIHVGEPLDIFGNRVDGEGESYDKHGRPIDLRRYVEVEGEPRHVPQRDQQYIKELGEVIADSYRRNAVALSTHVLAFALFQMVRAQHPERDVFQLLRVAEPTFATVDVLRAMDETLEALRDKARNNELHLGDVLIGGNAEAVLNHALRIFGTYHTRPVVAREGDRLVVGDMKLLLYYHNRLSGYGLERAAVRAAR